ncbi:MAG: 5-(carboxyamino)imidazole ribonucleotide mutase [Halobacteriales archaeon]|nr:5-(carboxyamino)imidazole ribonucleotide mutase [Halobacteriales archaeon]
MSAPPRIQVVVVMGSKSDWETMKNAADTLKSLGITHESRVLSAHRAPDELHKWLHALPARGCQVVIAGAGGAAHLAGVCASQTVLPVLGVPMQTKSLGGMDSLLSTAQMPKGIPVGTLAIGEAGAANAAYLAAQILALNDSNLAATLKKKRLDDQAKIAAETLE